MPIGLAYAAAALRQAGHAIKVIDAFAAQPRQISLEGKFYRLGLRDDEVVAQIPKDAIAIVVYAINLTNHIAMTGIVGALKNAYPDVPVVILENTQAVTAYSLGMVAEDLYNAGADYLLTGEGDKTIVQLNEALERGDKDLLREIGGLKSPSFQNPASEFISKNGLDELPYPAWDLFPLQNYWDLRFAHGPQSTSRYLPLLTSRGCPYPCTFCVVPATNNQKWRERSAKSVVDEIEFYVSNFDVLEFHIEDLDPTILNQRTRDICEEIILRGLEIDWKIVAGTKVETIRDEDTVDLMAQAGCTYISISPETGSPRLLKEMRKPFNLKHAVKLVKRMNRVGIRSQACFVLGYPGETQEDLQMTWELVRDLTRQGVDEIALFIITPVPGSAIYDQLGGYDNLSELNFSPAWRGDYKELSRFRLRLYIRFLLWKLRYHPLKLLRQPFNFLRRKFETKMEMVPYRAIMLSWFSRKARERIF